MHPHNVQKRFLVENFVKKITAGVYFFPTQHFLLLAGDTGWTFLGLSLGANLAPLFETTLKRCLLKTFENKWKQNTFQSWFLPDKDVSIHTSRVDTWKRFATPHVIACSHLNFRDLNLETISISNQHFPGLILGNAQFQSWLLSPLLPPDCLELTLPKIFSAGILVFRFKPELWWLKPFIPEPTQEFRFVPNSGLWRFGPLIPESALDPRFLKSQRWNLGLGRWLRSQLQNLIGLWNFAAGLRLRHWIPQSLWKRSRLQLWIWQLRP